MEYKEIVITVSDEEIRVNPAVEVPIRLIKNEIKLQSSVARALQRVLRTYKFGNSNDKIFDNEDYLLLGQLLCQILIGKSVEAIIRMALVDIIDTENKTLKKRCRIYLEFDPKIDEELALLPWEYTWAELEGIEPSFLAADLQGQFDFIRRTSSKTIPFKPLKNGESCKFTRAEDETIEFEQNSPKKILVIFVYVKLEKLDTTRLEDLKNYFKARNFIVREIQNPTFASFGKDLDAILKEEKEKISSFIIHYYGHAMVQDNKGQISLMNKGGDDHDWITDSQFADFFQVAGRRPQIIFLQACSSGQIVRYTPSEKRGIALLLSLKEIPAVVAMQNDINVLDSFAFNEIFYTSVLQGDDVAEAVTKGRQYLGSIYLEENAQTKYSTNAFGAPILFISTKTPIQLIEKPGQAETVDKSEEKKITVAPERSEVMSQIGSRKAGEDVSQEKAESMRETVQAEPVQINEEKTKASI